MTWLYNKNIQTKEHMPNLQDQKVKEWTADYITALNDNFYNHQVDSYQRMVADDRHTDYDSMNVYPVMATRCPTRV